MSDDLLKLEGNRTELKNRLPELKLDAKQAQGFLGFFKSLPHDIRAVRFFDRRDYCTVHGENATFIARTYYHTTSIMRQVGSGSDALSSVSVSKNMFQVIIRDLLLVRMDHMIELYEGAGFKWRLVMTGSPGNLGGFEDILFENVDMQDSPVIVALLLDAHGNGRTVGLSYIDMANRVIGLAEFLDDVRFTNVESALVALGCKECLLPTEGTKHNDYKAVHDVLSMCGVMLTERKKGDFRTRDVTQDLGKLVKGSIEPVRDLVSGFDSASASLGALLSYTDLLADDSNYRSYTIKKYSLGNYMRLDFAAMRALSVLESKTDANKNFSLFGLMNRTCTAGMGKRLLRMWLKQPLIDVDEINSRLSVVEAFVKDTALRQDLKQVLKKISDIERLAHMLVKKRASLQHVGKLYQSSIRVPFIKHILERCDEEFLPLFKRRYLDHLETLTDAEHLTMFNDLVESSIELNELENGEYMISPSYDSALSELKSAQEALEHQIHELHKLASVDLDLAVDKALKLDKGTQFGHVFRITKKEEPKVRKKLSSHYIVLETRKDGVKFTNSKLKKIGDQYQKIVDEYRNCQKELANRVITTASSFNEVFESLANIISELDVLLSFADLAASCPTPYTRPQMTPSGVGDITLEGSRHPCVEAQDWVNFIPNDCRLVRGKSWFQIITGPNMGGKSTFIRQVGVIILMAQVGCFVPCDKASISVRDCIFARVGAGDCQLRGVSTFMQEMLETSSILKGATENSLIIIDELGRGTSTYDGFGLAWAICEHLVQETKAPTLFATHFHELTALADGYIDDDSNPKQMPGVANYHVSAHIDSTSRKLTMLYKVEPGACDQSFGIHVAEFANFPECVVALAREKAAELEDISPASILSCDLTANVGFKKAKVGHETDDVSRGVGRAHRFLKEFSELPLETMDLKHALDCVKKMKDEFMKDARNCQWLQQFL